MSGGFDASKGGFTYDIPAGGAASIGGVVGGGTQGSVLYVGAGGALAQDNANFFYDDTDHQLVMGAGSVGKPSLIFGDDTSGFYRPAANEVALSLGGVVSASWGSALPVTDVIAGIGRLRIDARTGATELCLGHSGSAVSGNQALRQTNAFVTTLNSATGQNVSFATANSTRWLVDGSTLSFRPGTDLLQDLGATASRLKNLFLGAFMEISEMVAPGTPGAAKARLYVKDNAGKQNLCIKWDDGVESLIFAQP